jgi:hypothetical protein
MHLAEDTSRVHNALAVVGITHEPRKEVSDWPVKRQEQYITVLKKTLKVFVVDNRRKRA